MVHDSIERWDLFQATKSKMRRITQNNPLIERERINDSDSEEPEDRINRLLSLKLQ